MFCPAEALNIDIKQLGVSYSYIKDEHVILVITQDQGPEVAWYN